MKKMSKVLALVLALTMVAALFVGCSNAKSDATNASGDNKPSGEKTVLTVEIFDRGKAFENGDTLVDNEATRWINKKFGEPNNIEVKFVAVPRSEEVTKLNLLMAGKTAPDIVFTYDMDLFYDYANKGGLAEISQYLDECPNLKKVIDGLPYGWIDGKLYGINAGRRSESPYVEDLGQFMNYIRKDWLDKLGLEVPNNSEELYQVLKAFRDADPKLLGTDRVIPMGLVAQTFVDEDWQQMAINCLDSFTKPMSEEEFATLPYLKRPGYKDGVQYMNKLFNEGLIDPDFALQNDWKMFGQNLSQGRIGFWSTDVLNFTATDREIDTLYKNNPDAEIIPIRCFTNAEGKNLHRCYTGADIQVMIPSFSKNVEAAMKYLDFVSNYENGLFLRYGEEGRHYKIQDGILVVKDMEKLNWAPEFVPRTFYRFETKEAWLNQDKFDLRPELNKIRVAGRELALEDTWHPFEFDRALPAVAKNTANLDKKFHDIMIKTIACKPAEFSELYDTLVEEYMNMGGQEVLDEKVDAYRDMMKNKK